MNIEYITAWSVLILALVFVVFPFIGILDETSKGYFDKLKSGLFMLIIAISIASIASLLCYTVTLAFQTVLRG